MFVLMHYKRLLISLCLMSMNLIGCVDSSMTNEAGTPFLSGTSWRLSAPAELENSNAAATTLRFGYRGSYRVSGSALHIPGEMTATMAACSVPVTRQASAFKRALQSTVSFVIDDKRLQLLDANVQVVAVFEAASLTLAGTSWDVVGYNNGKQAVVSVLRDSRINVLFGSDDQVTGDAGCNRYFASYQETDAHVVIGQPAATRRFCAKPDAIMQQEQDYLAALHSVKRFQLDGDRLTLRTQEGAIAVSLSRSPRTPAAE